jgi:hypothetical protein
MIKSILFALALVGCGGMAVDYMPDGGVDGTTNPEYESEKVSDTEEKWCIGCLAGVSIPRSLPFGYGLRPITETIGGKLTQFPACQGTHTSMPHACRFPIGNKFWFGPPPTAWSAGRKEMYRQTVVTVGAQLSASGITWGSAQISGGTCPWDNANDRYKHTEILTKPDITNSPHPLFRLTLQGINNTTNGNLKGYLACEIEFDHLGPLGIGNNGGNCTGNCVELRSLGPCPAALVSVATSYQSTNGTLERGRGRTAGPRTATRALGAAETACCEKSGSQPAGGLRSTGSPVSVRRRLAA